MVKILLDAGADVEHQNENGHTPLMEAASCGHIGMQDARSSVYVSLISVRLHILGMTANCEDKTLYMYHSQSLPSC